MAKRTVFGRELRTIRGAYDETMKEMADKLEVPSSFLSAVETGLKRVPETLIEKLANTYQLEGSNEAQLRKLAENSQPSVTIDLRKRDAERRELATMFARSLPDLDAGTVERIRDLLGGSSERRSAKG